MRLCKTLPYVLVPAILFFIAGGAAPGAQAVKTATPSAAAQQPASGPIDSSFLTGLRWRSIGPSRGGRSQAVAGSSKRPQEYYFGATGGGVWKTTDGGLNWRPVGDQFLRSLVGRSDRHFRIQPRCRLRRDGGNPASRQHHPGRRRLQEHRWRPHVDPRRSRENAGDRAHPCPSRESGHRLRRGARRPLRCDARSRGLQIHRRR